MTLPSVRFLPEAVEDLLETQRWYGARESALAQDFAETVAAAIQRILVFSIVSLDPRSDPQGGAESISLCRLFPRAGH